MSNVYPYVVIGGGVAGTSCVEILAFLEPSTTILFISNSPHVKTSAIVKPVTKTLDVLSVNDLPVEEVLGRYLNVEILIDRVTNLNYRRRVIDTATGRKIKFLKLSICTGARPNNTIPLNPKVIELRDKTSIETLVERLSSAKKIMIVGNGGIAADVIHHAKNVEKIWVIRGNDVCQSYIDDSAPMFFRCDNIFEGRDNTQSSTSIVRLPNSNSRIRRRKHFKSSRYPHASMGPEWYSNYNLVGSEERENIHIEFNTEVQEIIYVSRERPLKIILKNHKVYFVDFVISATGVIPNVEVFKKNNKKLKLAPDGGIFVNWKMETSLPDVYAAGDACTAGWELSANWFQKRLWSQARQMGMFCAESMVACANGLRLEKNFRFEIFSHLTYMFGFKVVLLGLYNGQTLINGYEVMVRGTREREYVKLVIKDGVLRGALLVGETHMERICETLILNKIYITPYGRNILYPEFNIYQSGLGSPR